MQRKKLAVITARADDRVQKDIICGISEAALAADTDVIVFSNIYNHWSDDKLLTFENVIYDFFDPTDFDGVVITGEAFMDISVISGAVEKIRAAKIPAVVTGGEIDGFESIYCDDEGDMERICEHLISVHNITDIDILTGPQDNQFALRRLNGCKRAFEKHGIAFDERKVFYGDFWYGSGYDLAQRYLNGELPLPQAIVCTNDCMAYQLCDTLSSSGIKIPEQLAVTGYDCTGGRVYHNPVLTTYRADRREIGIKAANMLLGTEYDIGSGDRIMLGNTCTCGTDQSELNTEINLEHLEHPGTFVSNFVQFSTAQFTQALTLTQTLWDYFKVINSYLFFHEANSLFFCLDKDWSSAEFSGSEYLCCVMDGTEELREPLTIRRNMLLKTLEEIHEKASVSYFCPLCFQTRLYGYTVFSYQYPERFRYQIREWYQIVTNSLEFLRLKNDIHYLTLCQKTSSLYDALTGFCKLKEFRRRAAQATDKSSLLAVKIGFSNEKEYAYDSNRRNDIISAVAIAIKQVCTNREICCRTEDDVFIILCSDQRELISERLRVMLHRDVQVKFCENPQILSFAESECCAAAEIDGVLSRCRSTPVQEIREELPQLNSLLELRREVLSSPHKAPDIDTASRRLCVSKGYFRAIYRKCFGVSYVQDCINERIVLAKYLLCTTVMSIYAVALQCGYADEKYFARQFHQNVDCSPLQYRKKYCGSALI